MICTRNETSSVLWDGASDVADLLFFYSRPLIVSSRLASCIMSSVLFGVFETTVPELAVLSAHPASSTT